MNLTDLWATARRYLAVTLTGVLVTALAAVAMWFTVPVFSQAQTQLVLLNPAKLDEAGRSLPTNPLITIGSRSAQVMASTMVTVAQSDAFRHNLENAGVTSEIAVSGGPAGGIVIQLTATGPNDTVVRGDLQTVRSSLETDLASRQTALGAPANQLYRFYEFVEPSEPVQLPNDRVRSTALTGALGVGTTIFVLALLESSRRRVVAARPPGSAVRDGVPSGGRRR